ncbi:MAG: S1 RNA-binding domain-containing protein, partial [Myxococcales bacterium]|nr:S1 RNA-binding domain-containing protein [Myxococcales bacterium]
VDIGVHQDGLVHVSELADRFIRDPNEAAKVGDKLKVRVLEVDQQRKRIRLSAKSGAPRQNVPGASGASGASGNGPRPGERRPPVREQRPAPQPQKQFSYNPFEKLARK